MSKKTKRNLGRKSKGRTTRQKEIQREIFTAMVATVERAELSEQERDFTSTRWFQNYERAFFGKTGNSEKKREAMRFLRNWRCAELYDRESLESGVGLWGNVSAKAASEFERMQKKLIFLAPLVHALNDLDVEFCKGLAQAVEILSHRIYNSKNPNIGTGDTHIDKWLLEYAVENRWEKKHTPR